VEQDDDAMEAYLEGNEPDIDTIKRCIRKGTIKLSFFPTYCGSAFKNKGVQNVLDARRRLPAGSHRRDPQPEVDLEGNPTGNSPSLMPDRPAPRAGLQDHGRQYGALTFTRIYSGKINKGDQPQHVHRQDRAHRPHGRDARQRPHRSSSRRGRR
jgi:elongation factor G